MTLKQKDQGNNDVQVNVLIDMIGQLQLTNESVNPTKASGIAPAIKSKVTLRHKRTLTNCGVLFVNRENSMKKKKKKGDREKNQISGEVNKTDS